MSSDYVQIGKEILKELEIDPTRLGEALSTLNEVVRESLKRDAWDKVSMHCELAYELCDAMHGSEESREWSSAVELAHAEGIFHAYEGISHLYQAEEAREKNLSEEGEDLARATHCLEKSRQSFRFDEYRDQWNESVIYLSLGRLYRGQNRLNDALLAFEKSCAFSDFNRLSIERRQEIEKVASMEIERTRRLFGDQKPSAPGRLRELPPPMQHKLIPSTIPIIGEIAAGKEKPISNDIRGYVQKTDEFEFEFDGQTLKVESPRGSQPIFPPEYGYVVAVQISGDSMDQAGIAPNDYVILQRQSKHVPLIPSPGDIVVVVFRDENNKVTLRRFDFDKSSGSVTLKPESSNPEHKTRVLPPEAFAVDNPSVEIAGIAIAVLKPSLPIIGEVEAVKEKPISDGIIARIPKAEGPLSIEGDPDAFFGALWSQFVNVADGVVVWDPESQKAIDPLEKELRKASVLINREGEPEEWESLLKAISDFCQYASTQANKTLVRKLRELVAELVNEIIASLSAYKHLASIEKQLDAIVHQLQH